MRFVPFATYDGQKNMDIDAELLEQAMVLAKKYDLTIASHAEDNYYKYSREGEYVAVLREIELAKK